MPATHTLDDPQNALPPSDGHARTTVVKADFHLHSAEDPKDEVDYSAMELLHRAHELGFGALAITLHDHVLNRPELFAAAEALGIVLIPAAEMRLEGADVVILNLTEAEAAGLRLLNDLQPLRAKRGDSVLMFAPHAFYVFGGSIGRRVEKHIDCFDAIEYCHYHTRLLNLNRGAVAIAQEHGKPLLATSDAHHLDCFGDHYSLIEVEGEPTMEKIFAAIRAGRVKTVSPPWPLTRFVGHFLNMFVVDPVDEFLKSHLG
jgi:predicted metal-dependent phosphoesterase TrpH